MNFTHLHVHTEYSLLDGAIRIKDLVKKVKENGMEAVAITDHGNMFGAIELYKECKKEGIKPIIGCEVYVAPHSRLDKNGKMDAEPNHLILLAMNQIGYQNLVKLVSSGYTDGFYYKPRIDMDLLREYNEGLICLSACLAGKVARQIVNGNIEGAKDTIQEFKGIFGKDRYYLEMQDNKLREQILVNQQLMSLSKEFGIGLVATNDCHYLKEEDYLSHEVLLCIQTRKTMNDEDRMSFSVNEFYVKTKEQMIEAFSFCQEAIENTTKIANMCEVEFEFGKTILPEFKIEEDITHLEYLKRMCYQGIKERYGEEYQEEVIQRLTYEIDVIEQMGFVDYFLIVADFIQYAKSKGIAVGPGRGSGAGSLAAYLMHITDIDPLKFHLIFERFLNPERISMPDFDVDFCYERRGEVIDYVARKYGSDHVAQIITFGTMAARQAVRDVARALDVSYQKADLIAKLIPHDLKMTIDHALKREPELLKMYEEDLETKKVIDIAKNLEGLARHASTHAAGVVITREPVVSYVPLYQNDGIISTEYTMTTLEELGLLKMDFLGLRTLTVISDTEKLVKQIRNIDVSYGEYDDQETYQMLCEGKTTGVFQMESPGFKQTMMKLQPDKLEDIIVMISLYRPGPMDQIPRYIRNKNHPDDVLYTHESLKDILSSTYGCMVYQEQVMQIFRDLAGYSLGRADLVRRAMGKKKLDVMEKEREIFVKGALENNIDEVSANQIFDEMAEFAKYAFNKSHAAAYAVVAYKTAYLKRHYTAEFMAATMNSYLGNQTKIAEYINVCKEMKIEVLRPDINHSSLKFTVMDDRILFSLASIKNAGEKAIDQIITERTRNGKFTSFIEFCERVCSETINKKCMESLIKSGCFDELESELTRFDLLDSYEKIVDNITQTIKNNYANQISFFELGTVENVQKPTIARSSMKPSKKDLLDMEKEMIGLYVSGHPLDEYTEYMKQHATVTSKDLEEEEGMISSVNYDGKNVVFCGILTNTKTTITKSGKMMMFGEVEDRFGSVEIVVFATVFQRFHDQLKSENMVKISGKLSLKEEEKAKILVSNVELMQKERKIYIKLPKDKFNLEVNVLAYLTNLEEEYKGNVPVYLFYEGTKKMKLLERDSWLKDTDETLQKLYIAFGAENVKMK